MRRWAKKSVLELIILGVYAVVAIAFTYPFILHLTNHLPGAGTDPYLCYWSNWWTGRSIFEHGISMFFCPLVFYPEGAHLNGEPIPFGIAFGLLSKILPDILAFNLLYLFQYVFAAWACYRLALYLWNRHDVAFLAGLIFGYSPYMTLHGLGHFNLINTGFLPLGILTCFMALDRDRFRIDLIVISGILFGLTAISSNYYLIFSAAWLLGLSIFLVRKGSFRFLWSRLVAIAMAMGTVIFPQMFAMIKALSVGYYRGVTGIGQAYLSSIDLLGILVPYGNHPLWGEWSVRTFQSLGSGSVERTAFLGVTVLILSILGWWRCRERLWVSWTLLWTGCAWVLSLGPILQVAGRSTLVPLPGIILTVLPVLKNARSAGRWMVLVYLGIALLAAGGAKWLLEQKIANRRIEWLSIPIIALILFEFIPIPYPTLIATVPKQVYDLPLDVEHPAILNLPLGRGDGFRTVGEFDTRELLLQTVHHRPVIGGDVARMRAQDTAILEEGLLANVIQVQSLNLSQRASNLRGEGIKDVIRSWGIKGNPIIKVLRLVVGEKKMQQILNSPPANQPHEIEPLARDQAMAEADRLGIGYVIAIDVSRPEVRAALDYLSHELDLTPIGVEGEFAYYKVNYHSANKPREKVPQGK